MAKTKVTRKQVEEALKAGAHVGFSTGQIVKRDQFGRFDGNLDALFGKNESVEAAIVRDPNGHITRAGMEHAIRSGGSVMLGGENFTDVDALPDDDQLEALHAREDNSAAVALDTQIAALTRQRAAMNRPTDRMKTEDFGMSTKEAATPPPANQPATGETRTAGGAAAAATAGDYDKMNKEELLSLAKEREIEGRSGMNKEELAAAIRADDKKRNK